jgi:hypothetical protein
MANAARMIHAATTGNVSAQTMNNQTWRANVAMPLPNFGSGSWK